MGWEVGFDTYICVFRRVCSGSQVNVQCDSAALWDIPGSRRWRNWKDQVSELLQALHLNSTAVSWMLQHKRVNQGISSLLQRLHESGDQGKCSCQTFGPCKKELRWVKAKNGMNAQRGSVLPKWNHWTVVTKNKISFFEEFVSTDKEELQNFTRPPSLDRAVSAQPDFSRPVDVEDADLFDESVFQFGNDRS